MREYSIYIIRNKVNSKVYIGQTCQGVHTRFMQHMKPSTTKQRGSYKIYNAINKYGKENFFVEELENGLTSEQADEREVFYIEKFDSYKNGYNSTKGADKKTISTIQDLEKLNDLFESGATYEYIAKEFGVHKETVARTVRQLGKNRKPKPIPKEILYKYKDSKTNKEIAEILGVHNETISRAFKKYGIKRGRGCNNKFNRQNQKMFIRNKNEIKGQISLFNKHGNMNIKY